LHRLSACLWSLRQPFRGAATRARLAGFDCVDVRPDCWSGIADQADASKLGVAVSCVGITPVQMAQGLSLESLATTDAPYAVPYLTAALEQGRRLGATRAYMVTPSGRVGDAAAYRDSIRALADRAGALGMKLCIEPTPGRALATSAEVLAFVRGLAQPALHVLIDLGHNLITGEDPAEAVKAADDRLGYVHIDDNDGKSDLHWGLFDGVLRPAVMDRFLAALDFSGYDGTIGIEIRNSLPSPMTAVVASRDHVVEWGRRRTSGTS
jgi:sugar phosphate isomerase/epimerase